MKSDPRGHAIKKGLCAGQREKGDEFNDIVEAIDALLEDAEITRRKARKEKALSPKHLARLETLLRAEAIVEAVKSGASAVLTKHLNEIRLAGMPESGSGHLNVTISDSAESSRGWKEDGL